MKEKSSGLNTAPLSVRNRHLAGVLCNWEGLLQKHFHDTVEAQTVMFFLHVASKDEPVDISAVGQLLGLSKAASSRNYYRLADGKTGTDGLELITAQVDYNDRRRMPLVLTPKGVQVAKELTDYISERVMKLATNEE